MPLTPSSNHANTPAIQLLRAKLAHALPNAVLCPMHQEITSWHPDAVDREWCAADTQGSVVYVVFNFESWEMFEFEHPPGEVVGAPVIDVGGKVGLFVMDPVGREFMGMLRNRRLQMETEAESKDRAKSVLGALVEAFEEYLEEEEGQTPAFRLVQLLVDEKVLSREVCAEEVARRVVECEVVVQLAD